MQLMPENEYAAWRAQARQGWAFRETDTTPPEALLQQVWLHQRLRRDSLRTLDGRVVRVIHPGFWNREAGPDFRQAVIQFEGERAKSGDVELDLEPQGWSSHGHVRNPEYKEVILHVVWARPNAAASGVPCVALKPCLDSPWTDLAQWLDSGAGALPKEFAGRCSGPLAALDSGQLDALLQQAAEVRLAYKAEQLQARAKQCGWEQALWEGLLAGLGYKHNAWPMRRLAEMLGPPLGRSSERIRNEARIFGLSGLLPTDASALPLESARRLKVIWSAWWREQGDQALNVLPSEAWRLDGVRPANHPQRRLALAAQWASCADLFARLEQWFLKAPDASAEDDLAGILQPMGETFWQERCTFRSAPLKRTLPMLGKDRVSDLAINVILPWFMVRAMAGKNRDLEALARRRFFAWPAGQDNSALKQARERLFAGTKVRLNTAALQQGLLQITRDFCNHSNAVCDQCVFPQLVRTWKTEGR
ncbi:MAG TPA: DUF2851 family protein [Methylomirabilota bacterium]|nr:DUF2851 family protein [Methylomirabilota bacterium]